MQFNNKQLDTIRAGIRLLQSNLEKGLVLPNDGDIGDILTCSGEHDGLSVDEIEELYESINFRYGASAPNIQNDAPIWALNGVQTAIAKMYLGKADPNETAVTIAGVVSKESLAEFIVDAFNRGWITKFNLGINDDGQVS
jgi:hypothetical protein